MLGFWGVLRGRGLGERECRPPATPRSEADSERLRGHARPPTSSGRGLAGLRCWERVSRWLGGSSKRDRLFAGALAARGWGCGAAGRVRSVEFFSARAAYRSRGLQRAENAATNRQPTAEGRVIEPRKRTVLCATSDVAEGWAGGWSWRRVLTKTATHVSGGGELREEGAPFIPYERSEQSAAATAPPQRSV